jgi:hypothetical protein
MVAGCPVCATYSLGKKLDINNKFVTLESLLIYVDNKLKLAKNQIITNWAKKLSIL